MQALFNQFRQIIINNAFNTHCMLRVFQVAYIHMECTILHTARIGALVQLPVLHLYFGHHLHAVSHLYLITLQVLQ